MGLQGRQHLLSMKIEQPLRGKLGADTPEGNGGEGDVGAVLTWTQIHRCAALCCPVGSGAAFCIYLGPLSRSLHVGRHSVSSWFRLWPRPTLNLVSERSKTRTDENGMRRKEKYNTGKSSK